MSLEAEDVESLLIDFLNELVFLFDGRRVLPISLRISRLTLEAPLQLQATVVGDTYAPDRRRSFSISNNASGGVDLLIGEWPSHRRGR